MTAFAITGMHRSGTSMVANILRSGGLYLGADDDLLPPAPDNPDGFFEHRALVRLADELLLACGGAWDRAPHRPLQGAADSRVSHHVPRAEANIAELAAADVWGWKDPRISLTARFWKDLLPDLGFIVCVRHPFEVANSLKLRNRTSFLHSLSLWQVYYESLLSSIGDRPCLFVAYANVLQAPARESRRLLRFVQMPATADVSAVIKLDRRHHALPVSLREAGAPDALVELYETLSQMSGGPRRRLRAPAGELEQALADAAHSLAANDRGPAEDSRVGGLEPEEPVTSPSVLSLEARIDRIEDLLHEMRYRSDGLPGRTDVQLVDGCRMMVREKVPVDAHVVVIAEGDDALLDLYGRPSSDFPQGSDGAHLGHSLGSATSAIAHLEALRAGGVAFCLVPGHASWWLSSFPTFASTLTGRYQVVAQEPGVGLLVDLRHPRLLEMRSLAATVDEAADRAQRDVAVLDCTELGIAALLPAHSVFTPRTAADEPLPYLDHSVDVVVTQRTDSDEAARVAQVAVVEVVDSGGADPEVANVRWVDAGDAAKATTTVVLTEGRAARGWLKLVEEATGAGADNILRSPDAAMIAGARGDAVLLLEPGAIPLPGTVARARATLFGTEDIGAVAMKLLARDGSLEAAGTMVFSDGSTLGVAAGSFQVDAPWHEYVRECAAGSGALLVARPLIEKLAAAGDEPSWRLPELSARIWAAGFGIVYQPEAVAVRTEPGGAPGAVVERTSWVDARPRRPEAFDDWTWRTLLARDDPKEGAR